MRRFPFYAAAALLVAAASASAAVQEEAGAGRDVRDPEIEARASKLASELRCPVCQGLSIQDSPTPLAVEMKALIHEQLYAGRTVDEVRQYFVERYGEWVLLRPRARGFNLLVYLLPWLGVAAGLALITVAVRRWMRQGAATGAETG